MGGAISFFSRPLAPGSAVIQVDGGTREARHGFASAGVPVYGALGASVTGDYQEGGGYVLTAPANRGAIDVPSNVIQRNAYVRVNYAPSPKLSAFVSGHKFGDSRATGTPLSSQSRDQGDVDVGADYGSYAGGLFSVRAWDGRQDISGRLRSATRARRRDVLRPRRSLGNVRTAVWRR